MANYSNVVCPYCGKQHGARYRTDTHVQYVHSNCSKCHERITIIHGDGKCKAVKGYVSR